MALLAIKKDPSRRDLVVFGIGLPLVFLLVGRELWVSGSRLVAEAIWAPGALLALTFALVPRARRPIYVAWMYAVFPIAFVVSHVVLAAVYYLVFTPVSLLLRLSGTDPMNRTFDPTLPSYWIARDTKRSKASYFRQF